MRKNIAVIIFVILVLFSAGFNPLREEETVLEIFAEPVDPAEKNEWFSVPLEIIADPIEEDAWISVPLEIIAEPIESAEGDEWISVPIEIIADPIDPAAEDEWISVPLEIIAEPVEFPEKIEWISVPVTAGEWNGLRSPRVSGSGPAAASVDGIEYGLGQFIDHAVFLRCQYLENYEYLAEEYLAYGIPLSALNRYYEEILGKSGKEEFTREVLDHLVFAGILEIEGEKAGLAFSEEELDTEFRNLIGLTGDEDPGQQVEKKYHGEISPEFLKQIAKIRLYEAALFKEALQDHVFEEEMVDLRHILVENEETAQELEAKLAAGEDWDKIAAAYSLDTYTRDEHGSLGWIRRSEIDEALADAAFALEPGSISDPVQTLFGYHILSSAGKEMRPLEGDELEEAKQDFYYDWETGLRNKHTVTADLSACMDVLPEQPEFIPIETGPDEDMIPLPLSETAEERSAA